MYVSNIKQKRKKGIFMGSDLVSHTKDFQKFDHL